VEGLRKITKIISNNNLLLYRNLKPDIAPERNRRATKLTTMFVKML